MSLLDLAISPGEAARMMRDRTGFTVDELTGCWLFHERTPEGLGPARAFYVAAYGEVPQGFRLVHVCSGRHNGCVRPGHLDILGPGEELPVAKTGRLQAETAQMFAARLRDELEARDATVTSFAKELGLAASTLSSWLKGKTSPDASHAGEIANRLGWDGRPRRYVVSTVVQRVEVARSAGEAARKARHDLDRDDQPGKVRIVAVRTVK